VYPSVWEGFGVPVVEAMASGVPVITSENSSMQEIAGESALYVDPYDPASIAEKMMTLYKDEDLRNRLVRKGSEIVKTFNWDHSAKLLWEQIKLTAEARPRQT
jgi:glycosyltransferase involved in cell wall biosynthesis